MSKKPWRIFVNDRNYVSWKIYDLDTKNEVSIDNTPLAHLNPVEKRIFNNDIIWENGELVYSYIRECPTLAGILLLENNKTYGRSENKKRMLYKCIPDDKRLPAFLVPYDIKMGFSKNIQDKYIVFRFDHWNDQHPRGTIVETLGDVSSLEAFYEYKLYCRNLNTNNKDLSKKTHTLFHTEKTEEYIQKIQNNPNFCIEDRTHEFVFTIDPKNSLDYDDGFCYKTNPDGSKTVSIYIANVFFWMETFGLWQSFQKRVSTIYLPDRRRPMLPTILSDNLCSLLENQKRFAFCMDIKYHVGNSEPTISYSNVIITVKKNFIYEESSLLKNSHYRGLLELTKELDPYITESHGLIGFWMVFMNKYCGNRMFEHQVGIYRSVFSANPVTGFLGSHDNKDMLPDTKRLIYNWSSMCGQYVVYSDDAKLDHDLLNIKTYVHMTSPIRRLVDLLNQIVFFTRFSLVTRLSQDAISFLNEWVTNIDVLNEKMKSTLKVERECETMRKCLTRPEMLVQPHDAYVIGIRDILVNGVCMYKHTLYLEREKMILELKSEQKRDIYKRYQIRMYKIDAYGIASKIKLGWIEDDYMSSMSMSSS
jgi:exoribonuclease R